ncbi:hypothetical protein T492DRAFT_878233 [Pavlovales sp. CCMP2436]|nr:hypothetical protein T492DRAFT_878233 [Pavlovales sp. CCMP2436]
MPPRGDVVARARGHLVKQNTHAGLLVQSHVKVADQDARGLPVRCVGQAYVPLVPDDPTIAEDEQEIRRELEEEERYSRETDKLFKTVKDLPSADASDAEHWAYNMRAPGL